MADRASSSAHLSEGFAQTTIDAVWAKGRSIPGYSPAIYRADICGAAMEKSRYGDTKPGGFGWEIDHSVARGQGRRRSACGPPALAAGEQPRQERQRPRPVGLRQAQALGARGTRKRGPCGPLRVCVVRSA